MNLVDILNFLDSKECKLYRDYKQGEKVKGLFFVNFDDLEELTDVLGLDSETMIDVTLRDGYVAVEFDDLLMLTGTSLDDYKEQFDEWDYYFGKESGR